MQLDTLSERTMRWRGVPEWDVSMSKFPLNNAQEGVKFIANASLVRDTGRPDMVQLEIHPNLRRLHRSNHFRPSRL